MASNACFHNPSLKIFLTSAPCDGIPCLLCMAQLLCAPGATRPFCRWAARDLHCLAIFAQTKAVVYCCFCWWLCGVCWGMRRAAFSASVAGRCAATLSLSLSHAFQLPC